jgi:O-acetylserine/cysteine efflux transporter
MPASSYLLGISAMACWGALFPLAKFMTIALNPMVSVFLRFAMTSFLILPFLKPPKGQSKNLFICALLLFSLPLATQGVALKHYPSVIIVLSSQLQPIFVTILGSLLLRERTFLNQYIGMLAAFCGIYVLLKSPQMPHYEIFPLSCLLLSAIANSFGAIYLKRISLPPGQTILYGYLFGTLQVGCLGALSGEIHLDAFNLCTHQEIAILLGMGTLSIVANCLYTMLLRRHQASEVAAFAMLLPLFSILFGYFILHETLDIEIAIGGGLVLSGVFCNQVRSKFFSSQKEPLFEAI